MKVRDSVSWGKGIRGLEFKVCSSWFMAHAQGFGIGHLGFRVYGVRRRVQGQGFRVYGLELSGYHNLRVEQLKLIAVVRF